MKARFCEGAAGTGKTTRLMADLSEVLVAQPLAQHQRVLALSKMHGSRRRLMGRLAGIGKLGRRFDCMTIDSFARRLVIRWRALGRLRFGTAEADSFEEWCRRAGVLLGDGAVQGWVARRYPIVVVDEIQDSKGEQLKILQGLASSSLLLLAGDDFQDLDGDNENAAVAWARANSDVTPLSHIHRTDAAGLLAAAGALRGGGVVTGGPGFELAGVPKAALGAWHAAKFIAGRKKGETVALITPTSPAASEFVRDLMLRMAASPIGKKAKFGPYAVPWEQAGREETADLIARIGAVDQPNDALVDVAALTLAGDTAPEKMASKWFDRQRRVKGLVQFTAGEIRERMSRLVHDARTRRATARIFAAMTVHQAKNREFDNVMVLWPYETTSSASKQRRLLYNAVTRAKRRAIVIVQNAARLAKPPFAVAVLVAGKEARKARTSRSRSSS
jgi:hypothetical protein